MVSAVAEHIADELRDVQAAAEEADSMPFFDRLGAGVANLRTNVLGLGAAIRGIFTGGGGGDGGLAGALGVGAAAGGGRWGIPLLSTLFGVGLPFAALGSVGSFMGFGREHYLMTGLGLAGSAVGAGIGGGLLGLGALGTAGVGMGSDMAVAKSTLADTKSLSQAYDALDKAVAVYGADSRQAQIAQAQLNYTIKDLGGASAVGVAAEMRLAQASEHFNQTWDRVTQKARAAFVDRIAMPLLQVAQGYLPQIADAATRNFNIIGDALRPLFEFLSTTGHKIFSDLENVFARDLPIGVGIFVQSLELVLKTIDHIATSANFGSFMQRILNFVTYLNTTGFGKFTHDVDVLIALFHTWAAFVGAFGRVLIDLFTQTAGLGTSIVGSLTEMLNRLDAWMRSVSGKSALSSVFQAHKQEVLALLALIPPLVSSIAQVYLAIAPTATMVATVLLRMVGAVLNFLTGLQGSAGTLVKFGLGLAIIEHHGHPLESVFRFLTALPGRLMEVWRALSFVVGSFLALDPLTWAIAAAIVLLIGLWVLWNTHTEQAHAIMDAVGRALNTAWGYLKFLGGIVSVFITSLWPAFVGAARGAWSIMGQVGQVIGDLLGFFAQLATGAKNSGDGWRQLKQAIEEFLMSRALAQVLAVIGVTFPIYVGIFLNSAAIMVREIAILIAAFAGLAKEVWDVLTGNLPAAARDAQSTISFLTTQTEGIFQNWSQVIQNTMKLTSNQTQTDMNNWADNFQRNMTEMVLNNELGANRMRDDSAFSLDQLRAQHVRVFRDVNANDKAASNRTADDVIAAHRRMESQAPPAVDRMVTRITGRLWGERDSAGAAGDATGAAFAQGIQAGIANNLFGVAAAAANAVDVAFAAAAARAKAHSPSQLTREGVGVPLGQGIQYGIMDTYRAIGAAAAGAVDRVGESVDSARFQFSPEIIRKPPIYPGMSGILNGESTFTWLQSLLASFETRREKDEDERPIHVHVHNDQPILIGNEKIDHHISEVSTKVVTRQYGRV